MVELIVEGPLDGRLQGAGAVLGVAPDREAALSREMTEALFSWWREKSEPDRERVIAKVRRQLARWKGRSLAPTLGTPRVHQRR